MDFFIIPIEDVLKYQNSIEDIHKLEFRQLTDGRFAVNTSVKDIWPQIDWSLFAIEELTPEDFPTNSSIV